MNDAGTRLPPRTPWVAPLARFGAADRQLAGGKGANLGELVREGFPVPSGFVITTAAHAHALAAHPSAAPGPPAQESPVLPVPDELGEEILAACRQLGEGPVAVRSSAAAEDLPGAAFAGQLDTFLNVSGEAGVLDAVARCWASLGSERAAAYRKRHGIGQTEAGAAVVVQSMVPAELAGVLFTANPVSGERDELVVDAGRGLGESVVSGTVTPDFYVLDRAGRVKRSRRGGQQAGGSDEVPMLPADALRQLAALGAAAAWHFGCPQDIEWALARGRVWILQARPMTALPPPPVKLTRVQRLAAPFFVEMLPVRPYPLDVTGWMGQGMMRMVGRMAAGIGVRYPETSDLLPEEDSVVVRLVPPRVRPRPKVLALPVLVLRGNRRFSAADWTKDLRFREFEESVARHRAQDPAALDWQGLRRWPRKLLEGLDSIAALRTDYLAGAMLPIGLLHLRLALLGMHRPAAGLVAGARTRTTDANDALRQLAAFVRADAGLRSLFVELEPAELATAVSAETVPAEAAPGKAVPGKTVPAEVTGASPDLAGLRVRLEAFLAEYGHRETVSPLLSSQPTWRDAPEAVLGLVKALAEEDGPGGPGQGAGTRDALDLLLRHPALRNPRRRDRLVRLVHRAQAGAAFREDTHFYATQLLPLVRGAELEIGRRLAGAGVLERPEDVFHLRLEELEGIGDVAALGPEADALRAAVAARAAKRAFLAGVPLINPYSVFPSRRKERGALLTGTAASTGTAAGEVRLIRSPDEFGWLKAGEILVCPYTNPAWTPLFQRAAAVVVDAGGLGSHAAVVAREYGIPAVMGTRDGTKVLRDGQQVVVDGYRGRVTARS